MPFYALTTKGPVRIQRITQEPASVRCAVCVDGLAKSLPISPAYDAFVKRPTGVIERFTGHGAYRLDVDIEIDGGLSWQLAVFLAHVAQDEMLGLHVFATGQIDHDLNIRDVQHINEKLAVLGEYIRRNDIPSDKVVILLPSKSECSDDFPNIGALKIVRTVAEATDILGIDLKGAAQASNIKLETRPKMRWSRRAIIIGAAVFCCGVLGWFGLDMLRWKAAADSGEVLALEERLAEARQSVWHRLQASVFKNWLRSSLVPVEQFEIDRTILSSQSSCSVDQFRLEKAPINVTTCIVRWQAFSEDPDVQIVGRAALWPLGLGVEKPESVKRGSSEVNGRSWEISRPDGFTESDHIRLVVVVGRTAPRGPQPWYVDLLGAPTDSVSFRAARSRLTELGYTVTVRDWPAD